MQGLTALTIVQPRNKEGAALYDSFAWDICNLPALQELHLRGGRGWLSGASWASFLRPKS